MKRLNFFRSIFVMATAIFIASCSNNDNEQNKPFTTDPVEQTKFFVCEVNGETRGAIASIDTLFTEDDIDWFNVTTREIKFKDMDEPLYKRMQPFHEIEFHLGDDALFVVSSFVGDWDSRIFTNLVLHYDVISDPNQGHYYLQDCYPLQFAETDEVKANREKNAAQWETFTKYLGSKGKLKK